MRCAAGGGVNVITVDPTPSPFLGAGGLVGLEDHLEAGRLEELHAATGVHCLCNLLVAQPEPPAPHDISSLSIPPKLARI